MVFLVPTDTCYGLAGKYNREAYEQLYRLKGRSFAKPLALLVPDYISMRQYVEITDEQIEFLQKYPYPWSFLGKCIVSLPSWMPEGLYSMLSIRVASVCLPLVAREKIGLLQTPLFLTSANPSGGAEAKTFCEASEYFPELQGIDGGVCNHPPSDIFSLSKTGEIVYLRKNYGIG